MQKKMLEQGVETEFKVRFKGNITIFEMAAFEYNSHVRFTSMAAMEYDSLVKFTSF